MFTRKEKLPALPEPPDFEAMLKDIKDAANSDPVFGITFENDTVSSETRIGNVSTSDDEEIGESDTKLQSTSQLTSDQAYLKVKMFVEQNYQMRQSLESLPTQCEQLKRASSELSDRLKSSKQQMLNKNF